MTHTKLTSHKVNDMLQIQSSVQVWRGGNVENFLENHEKNQLLPTPHPYLKNFNSSTKKLESFFTASIESDNLSPNFPERTYDLIIESAKAIFKICSQEKRKSVYIYTVLPNVIDYRSQYFNENLVTIAFNKVFSQDLQYTLSFSYEKDSLSELLSSIHENNINPYDSVWLGGVDSLLSPEYLRKYLHQQYWMTNDFTQGYIPGEGGCYINLTKHYIAESAVNILYVNEDNPTPTFMAKILKDRLEKLEAFSYESGFVNAWQREEVLQYWHEVFQQAKCYHKIQKSFPPPNIITFYRELGSCGVAEIFFYLSFAAFYLKNQSSKNPIFVAYHREKTLTLIILRKLFISS